MQTAISFEASWIKAIVLYKENATALCNSMPLVGYITEAVWSIIYRKRTRYLPPITQHFRGFVCYFGCASSRKLGNIQAYIEICALPARLIYILILCCCCYSKRGQGRTDISWIRYVPGIFVGIWRRKIPINNNHIYITCARFVTSHNERH